MNMKKSFFGLLAIAFILASCSYKPMSYYSKKSLGKRIYVNVSISRKDPKNSVLIKDAFNEAIISRFGAKLSPKSLADTQLNVSIQSIDFIPILYDLDGYAISYKALLTLNIKIKSDSIGLKQVQTSGEFDFPIEANSVISDNKRFEAIRNSSLDALNEFISVMALKGMQNG